ncbi:NlpC/P60 family protein [Plastorhodobacter daqingensis]|uniref:NlpC/P60 family protein n=1 Tax=Plastorhodobacter daqingensis TaxID=1387281 RepID=A0ABW2URK6_9RHOB
MRTPIHDRRLIPFNGKVAAASLWGQVDAEQFVEGEWHRVILPVADLLAAPDGPRDRQVLLGERVLVLERRQDMAYGQIARDGYCGWIRAEALGPDRVATHWIAAPGSHGYPGPDIKLIERCALSFGAGVTAVAEHPDFVETDLGLFIPRQHLRRIGDWFDDAVAVAELFLGTPYLWGGNSRTGIDCSGLVQAAYLACGISCPGDSDLQQACFGTPLPEDALLQRGDLLFWKGHVALVADENRILHANGHAMSTCHEATEAAITRIAKQGGGPVTARRRPPQDRAESPRVSAPA